MKMRQHDYVESNQPLDAAAAVAPIDVLLIEDDAEDVRLAIEALEKAKIVNRFVFARSVQEAALKLGDRRKPDLIIVDILLGDHQNGLAVFDCPCVADGSIPVVVYSRDSTPEIVKMVGDLGARAFIPKPLTGRGLREVVERIDELRWAIVKIVDRPATTL